MAKFDALETYLRDLSRTEIEIAIADIERMVGRLPKAAAHPSWWSRPSETKPATRREKPWQSAGYNAELLGEKARVQFVRHGYKIARRNENTVWIAPENPSEEEIAPARQAFHGLIKFVAEATADACHRLRIEFDMDDPEVAREVFKGAFEALFMSPRPHRSTRRKTRSR